MIKKILRKILTQKQWGILSSLKQMVFACWGNTLLFAIKFLPDPIVLDVKKKLDMVRKMDYPRCDIFLNIDSRKEYDTRLNSCRKEPETVAWIETFFKKGDIFFDIGANVGAYSLVASQFYRGKVMVYAFEPGFTNFAQLCKNILLNRCEDCITPLQIALADKTAVDVFNYQNITPGGALHALGQPIDHRGNTFDPTFRQFVLAYRIDDLIEHLGIPVPNHLKIDVDGTELAVLKGAEKTLSNNLVKSLMVEIMDESSQNAEQIINFLVTKGFEFRSNNKNEQPSRTHNMLFSRASFQS